jgi:glycosyltransferase involved in cell wall biosynthesis
MDLYYLAHMRFPNEKAHGKQVREMCNALVAEGRVTLVVPTRPTEGTPKEFGLDPRVMFVRIPTPNLVYAGRVGFLCMQAWFAIGAALYVLLHRKGARVLTREYACAAVCAWLGIPIAWEAHRGEWNWLVRSALASGARMIVISQGLKNFYMSQGVASDIMLIAPDGVDLSRYEHLPSKEEARRLLSLPQDKKILIYNGHLHTWKGAGVLAQAAGFLPDSFLVMFMGGTDEDIAAFRTQYGNMSTIRIIGRKDDSERPLYLRAADVAVLPNSAGDVISVQYTSPLKLFGYMAAGTPIVASDLPSIREVLDEHTAFFATADSPRSFADTLQDVANNPTLAKEKGECARNAAVGYDWHNRASQIIDFLK